MKRVLDLADRWFRAVAYVFTAFGGAWLFYYRPPYASNGAIELAITFLWAALICMAFPAAVATYRGNFGREYWCLPLFTGGLVLALIHGYATLSPESIPRVMFVSALAAMFVGRWVALNHIIRLAEGA